MHSKRFLVHVMWTRFQWGRCTNSGSSSFVVSTAIHGVETLSDATRVAHLVVEATRSPEHSYSLHVAPMHQEVSR